MDKKLALGYPRTNILLQSPTRAIPYQNSRIEFDGDISGPAKLVDVLCLFFEYRQPHQEDWGRAIREFSEHIPEIAKGANSRAKISFSPNRKATYPITPHIPNKGNPTEMPHLRRTIPLSSKVEP